MFKLDIAALETAEKAFEAELEILFRELENCDSAIFSVVNEDFVGKAQVASLERYNDWVNNQDAVATLIDGCWTTCNTARIAANKIMKKCDELPAAISSFSMTTAENTGTLLLNDTYYRVSSKAQEIVDVDLDALRSNVAVCRLELGSTSGLWEVDSALSCLSSSIDEAEEKLSKFNTKYVEIVDDVCRFESEISQALVSIAEGDIEGHRNRLAGLLATEAVAVGLAATEAGQLRGRGTWSNPANANFNTVPSGRASGAFSHISRTVRGAYVPKHTHFASLARNRQIASFILFKTAGVVGKALPVVTTVIGLAEMTTQTVGEYNRNPYLPERLRGARTQATLEASAISVGSAVGSAAIGGAATGIIGGPIGIVVGAVIGTGFGMGAAFLLDYDGDGNGEPLTQDYIDWRTDNLMQTDTRYVGQLGYSFQSNVEGLE